MAITVGKLLSTLTTGTGMKVEKYLLNSGDKAIGTKTIQYLPAGCKLKQLGVDMVEITQAKNDGIKGKAIALCKDGKTKNLFYEETVNTKNNPDMFKTCEDYLNSDEYCMFDTLYNVAYYESMDKLKDFIKALKWTKNSGF